MTPLSNVEKCTYFRVGNPHFSNMSDNMYYMKICMFVGFV